MELLDLPDDALMEILSLLDASSLYDISLTSVRLSELAKSPKLWKYIDARRTPNREGKIDYCCERTYEKTEHIRFRGNDKNEFLIDDAFFDKLCTFNYITILVLENQFIDGYKVRIANFPSTLIELSLRRTMIDNNDLFFRYSGEIMCNLRVLLLNECNWLEASNLMSLAKYPNLEILSIYKCRNIKHSIAYMSLALIHGFHKLKIFDTRLSPIGCELIKYLYKSQSLLGFYIQNNDFSYRLDYLNRKLDLAKGAKPIDYYIEDNEFDLMGTLTQDSMELTDHFLSDYSHTQSVLTDQQLPTSVLYEDPYDQCECQKEAKTNTENNSELNNSSEDKSNNSLVVPSAPPLATQSSSDDDSDDDDNEDNNTNKRKSIKIITEQIQKLKKIISTKNSRNVTVKELFERFTLPSPLNPNSPSDPLRHKRRRNVVQDDNVVEYGSADNQTVDEGTGPSNRKRSKKTIGPLLPEDANCFNANIPGTSTVTITCKCVNRMDQGPIIQPPEINHSINVNQPPIHVNELVYMRHPLINVPERRIFPCIIGPPPMHFGQNENVNIRINAHYQCQQHRIPLKRLSLRGNTDITDISLIYLKGINLNLLDLTYTKVTEEGIKKYLAYHPDCRIIHEKFCTCKPKLHF